MKDNKHLILLIVCILTSIMSSVLTVWYLTPEEPISIQRSNSTLTYIQCRDSVKTFILKHEGVRYEPYECVAGKLTVGAGHVITDKDNYRYPISHKTALKLLDDDLKQCEEQFNKCTNKQIRSTMSEQQKWSIIHFIFCYGITKYNSSTLKRSLHDQNRTINELKRWIHYRTPKLNIVKRSMYLAKVRDAEISFYKTGRFNWETINRN